MIRTLSVVRPFAAFAFAIAALPLQAVTIQASAVAASALPAPVDVSLDLANGDFLIHANPGAPSPHVTGDGIDEATSWQFDFTADPGYAALVSSGGLSKAYLTLTLNTALFDGGVGPVTDLVRPSDAGGDVFPAWVMPGFITGVSGTYTMGSIGTDLIADVGMDGGQLFNWLVSHGGSFPMLYADDAIVTAATLQLVSAAVPEPGSWALMLAGLAAAGTLARRHR